MDCDDFANQLRRMLGSLGQVHVEYNCDRGSCEVRWRVFDIQCIMNISEYEIHNYPISTILEYTAARFRHQSEQRCL